MHPCLFHFVLFSLLYAFLLSPMLAHFTHHARTPNDIPSLHHIRNNSPIPRSCLRIHIVPAVHLQRLFAHPTHSIGLFFTALPACSLARSLVCTCTITNLVSFLLSLLVTFGLRPTSDYGVFWCFGPWGCTLYLFFHIYTFSSQCMMHKNVHKNVFLFYACWT